MDSPIMLGVFVLLGSVLVLDSMPINGIGTKFCTEFGRTYSEGEMMELPDTYRCQRYKCMAGRTTLVSAGCEFNGTCKPLWAYFIDGCSTKQCIMHIRNKRMRFSISVKAPRCQDYKGICRDSTDHYADFERGHLRESCRCSIFAETAQSICM